MGEGGCCPTMDLLRSEQMQLVQFIIPIESAHRTISYLGDLGLFQFKDVSYTLHFFFFAYVHTLTFVYMYFLLYHLHSFVYTSIFDHDCYFGSRIGFH